MDKTTSGTSTRRRFPVVGGGFGDGGLGGGGGGSVVGAMGGRNGGCHERSFNVNDVCMVIASALHLVSADRIQTLPKAYKKNTRNKIQRYK